MVAASDDKVALGLDETIAAAVKTRVETEVVRALSGDEVIGRYVAAALAQPVESKGSSYRTVTEPFMSHILRKAIQEAAKAAAQALILEEMPAIQEEIRKALRRRAGQLAEALATSLVERSKQSYGLAIDIALKMPGDQG